MERFYLRGGFAYERLSLPNKLAMKMFFKMQEKQAATDPRAAEMLSGMRGGFDGTDRAAIAPVVAPGARAGGREGRGASLTDGPGSRRRPLPGRRLNARGRSHP